MKNNQTIAKIGSRKDHLQVLNSKKRLKDLHYAPLSLINEKKIFVNEGPWHYWNSPLKIITHNIGLKDLFPDTDTGNLQLSTFSD